MSPAARPAKFLLHESICLAVWISLAISLTVTGKLRPEDAILPLQIGGLLAMVRFSRKGDRWQLARLVFSVVAINLTYFWMGSAIPRLRVWRADETLVHIDRLLFGDCLAVMVSPHVQGWSRDLLSCAYLTYYPLWVGLLTWASFRDEKTRLSCFSGITMVQALGFCGYLVMPAAGPFCYAPLAARLTSSGSWITHANSALVEWGCNRVDVFPSLHTACGCFVLLSAWTFSRRVFSFLLAPCLLTICATIGLQYHYFADVVAGATLGTGMWWFTVRAKSTQFVRHQSISLQDEGLFARSLKLFQGSFERFRQ